MVVTPIPEREAAKRLGISLRTIRNAVERGDLIRVPVTGQIQHVSSEQVELFVGKNRILRGTLTPNQMQQWQVINEEITQPKTRSTVSSSNVSLGMDADQFVKALINNGVVSTSNQLTFQSALTDEQVSKAKKDGLAFALLLGLAVLLIGKAIKSDKAYAIGERFMDTAGILAEELLTADAQRKAELAVNEHPQEAMQTYNALKEAGAIAA